MLPRVVMHNEASLDGRMDRIAPDLGQYYELASRWEVDAILTGSNTIIAGYASEQVPDEDDDAFKPPQTEPDDSRPLFVIADSRGRIRFWHQLRKEQYWRAPMALCSHATPRGYLEYLEKRHIEYIVAGDEQVDLRAALEELNARHGVELVRADAGGTLNGALLRGGLVDEVSVLVNPSLVGGTAPRSIFTGSDLTSSEGVIDLKLTHVEQAKGDVVWLRYEVVK